MNKHTKNLPLKACVLLFFLLSLLSACGQESPAAESTQSAQAETAQAEAAETATTISAVTYSASELAVTVDGADYTLCDTTTDGSGVSLAQSDNGYALLQWDSGGEASLLAEVDAESGGTPRCLASDGSGGIYLARYDSESGRVTIDCYTGDAWQTALYSLDSETPPTMLAAAGQALALGLAKNNDPVSPKTDTLLLLSDGQAQTVESHIDYFAQLARLDESHFLLYAGVTDRSVDVEPPTEYAVWTLDAATGAVSQSWTLGDEITFLSISETELLLSYHDHVWSCDAATGNLETDWFSLTGVGLGSSQSLTAAYVTEDGFLLFTSASEVYRVAPASEEAERETVTLGYLEGDRATQFLNWAADYNLGDHDYQIETVGYADAGELGLAIVSGEGPDLLEVYGLSLSSYENDGTFADLNGFFENDALTDREDFVQSVLSLYETDGNLYTMPADFLLWGLDVDESLLNGQDSLSMEQLLAVPQENIYWYQPLARLLNMDSGLFFREDAVQTLADYITFSAYFEQNQGGSPTERLLSQAVLYDPASTLAYWEPKAVIPYPNQSGLTVDRTTEFAILTTAQNAEGAWDVLCYFLSPAVQDTVESAMPVLSSSLEAQLDLVSEEDAAWYRELIESCGAIFRSDATVEEICYEEAAYYFNGDKTAEAVAEIAVNRVQTYYMEQ